MTPAYPHPGGSQPLDNTSQTIEGEILRFSAQLRTSDILADETHIWILDEIVRIFSAESAALYLADHEDERWLVKKYRQNNTDWVSQRVNLSEVSYINETMRRAEQISITGAGGEWLYCFPLIAQDKTTGVIEVRSEGEIIDLELLALCCNAVCDQLLIAKQVSEFQEELQDLRAFQGQLLKSRDTLRALFDSSPTSIYIVDGEYTLMAINMRRADLAGREPRSLVGEQCYAALYQRKAPCKGCLVSQTLQSGEITRRIMRSESVGTGPIELEISTFPIWDAEESIVQAFLFEEDVTEREQLQASLAQSEKLAAVGQLAASVAHEINNPLTTILANAQLVQRMLPAAEDEIHEMADLIIQASERASQAVRDLLDFARREHYELRPTELNETIQRTLSILEHELRSNSISLTYEPEPDLPLVNASPDHLQGVWLNLIINAVDAIAPGPGEIRISTRRAADRAQVTIIDNGQGIAPEHLTHVFEPFYTTKGPGQGTGLGLSVCQQIVTRHGGQITVSSQLGEGTTFIVLLPFS
jgi:two-component system NtrC family sensor kinase